jgi:hypothetical protein
MEFNSNDSNGASKLFYPSFMFIYFYLFYFLLVIADLPAMGIRDLLLPSIQNLLKDLDALDPAHKEALEIISRERSGGTLESISKVMGAHLGIASSVSSFFGENSLLTKKEGGEEHDPAGPTAPEQNLQAQPESTRFGRIMRSGFGDILRGQSKGQ